MWIILSHITQSLYSLDSKTDIQQSCIFAFVFYFFIQYIAYLLDRKGDGSHSCYINEAYEGQMNTVDVIHNVVNFGKFSCIFT